MDTRKTDIHASAFLHAPFGYPDGRTPSGPETLSELFRKTNTVKAIVVPEMRTEGAHMTQSNEDAERMTNELQKAGESVSLFRTSSLDPRMIYNSVKSDFSAYIRYYGEKECVAVGYVYANVPVTDPLTENLVSHAANCGKTVCLETGLGKRGLIDDEKLSGLSRLTGKFEKTPFVVCLERSASKKLFPVLVSLCEKRENVYIDLSCVSVARGEAEKEEIYGLIKSAASLSGRLLYGSYVTVKEDLPYLVLPALLDKAVSDGVFGEKEYAEICRENAAKVFGI